jgi:hypothetical protein
VLAPAAAFHDYILAVHILAVIVAFGVLFIYPLLSVVGVRAEPEAMPWFHRFQHAVHTRVQAPGLGVVVLAGIYLASDLHVWSHFFVAWGIIASIVIGAVGGSYLAPRETRLIELADRDLAAAPVGSAGFAWSDEYRTVATQAERARYLQLAIAVVTVVLMSLQV